MGKRKAHQDFRLERKKSKYNIRQDKKARGQGFFDKIGSGIGGGLSNLIGGKNGGQEEYYSPAFGGAVTDNYGETTGQIQENDNIYNTVPNNSGTTGKRDSIKDTFGNIKFGKIGIKLIAGLSIAAICAFLIRKILNKKNQNNGKKY